MSKISEYLNKIKTAIYGREVRDAIHDSIKECYTDVTSGATLANTASDKANSATEKANTAASNADTATASANSAANLANAAASNADNKAALADKAATDANAATESANAAASSATAKAALADTAATGATAAMNSANEAADNANAKATLADEATANANAATESANAAASNADDKAALADKATIDANSAANQANTAAATADDKAALADNAAGLIRRMNVSTTQLPPGSTPTSSLETVEDVSGLPHYSLVLGIPTGNTGATPVLTFKASTGEAGTSATVEVTGTAEAPIVHLTIPKGDTGRVENLVINGKPIDNGTITLTAADIGALPSDTAIPTKTSDLTNDSGFITADDSPVQSVNGKTGVVDLSAEDVGALSGTDSTLTIAGKAADAKKTGDSLNQLKTDIADEWAPGTYAGGVYKIYDNILYKAVRSTQSRPGDGDDWEKTSVTNEIKNATQCIETYATINTTYFKPDTLVHVYQIGKMVIINDYLYRNDTVMPNEYVSQVWITGLPTPKHTIFGYAHSFNATEQIDVYRYSINSNGITNAYSVVPQNTQIYVSIIYIAE